jgi:hypothetical protein
VLRRVVGLKREDTAGGLRELYNEELQENISQLKRMEEETGILCSRNVMYEKFSRAN